MITTDIGKWAGYLATAARRNEAVSPITDVEPTLTVEDAYAIQDAIIERRLASGERLVGAKVGLTSRAKQQEMGINEPVYGWLTDAMALEADSSLRLSTLIHPRVEPEIVFILGKALAGPGVGIHDVLDATSAICCGLEVLDSRFIDFRFLLPDVIADNTSASHFVLGTIQVPPTGIDLSLAGCLFEENGAVAATAAGAAILGHPAAAVAKLANFLGPRGRHLEAGWDRALRRSNRSAGDGTGLRARRDVRPSRPSGDHGRGLTPWSPAAAARASSAGMARRGG